MEKLFSYGTLQQENVQIETFNRTLSGTKDTLLGGCPRTKNLLQIPQTS